MTRVDQFESVFKSADKPLFHFEAQTVANILVVTDRPDEQSAAEFSESVRWYLAAGLAGESPEWSLVLGSEFDSIRDLLELVEEKKPDLICTYRNLHSQAWKWPYSLGEAVDLLTQVTPIPVMLFPHPDSGREPPREKSISVMALTDHLAGDDRLVNFSAALTPGGGKLHLTHVEDETSFERILDAISKIPSIDTLDARETILKQLLKAPHDYIGSCRRGLEKAGAPYEVLEHIEFGHRLRQCLDLVEKHDVDLLVINTKDDDQLAMHGLAYPLAVELRNVPLLMI